MAEPVAVLVVAGSRRTGSFTRAVCDAAADALTAAGARVARWDVADPVLPLADPPTDHLRPILRGVLAIALPTQVVAAMGDYDAEGRVSEAEILRRLDRLAHELVTFTEVIREVRPRLAGRYA
jgi:NAD(P)H-dependent FMN reductase